MSDKMNDQSFDKIDAAVNAIKSDQPTSSELEAAADRVRAVLLAGDKASIDAAVGTAAPLMSDRQLNSTDNYIAAIPDYLAGQLSSAQKILFEEEARHSIPLRRALNAARQQQAAKQQHPRRRRRNSLRWFASAAALAVVAVAWVFVLPQLPSIDQNQLAQVEDVQGKLYHVVNGRLQALSTGAWIDGRQELRTANNTTAMIKLDDGSLIEVDQRSEFSFTRRGRGNRIDVDRGKIIVAASPQGSGTLDVATDEFVVSVTGTIFEVGHGTNGSQVSVIEGKVNVHQQGTSTSLTPGEQFASRMGKTMFGFEDDIAWSRNAETYLDMLREVNALQQELEGVMETEPRYSTRLLNLVPENTVIYGAVPNAPEKIVEIYSIIRDRIQHSDRLSRAVSSVEIDAELNQLEEIMSWLAEVADTLGDETVAALVLEHTAAQNNGAPLILSEVDADAFRETLNSQLEEIRAALKGVGDENGTTNDHNVFPVNVIDDPSQAQPNQLSIWLYQDLLIASTSQQVLFDVQEAIVTGNSKFVNTDFYAELLNFYNRGAEFLGGVDVQTILSLEPSPQQFTTVGIDNAQFLIVHHHQQSGRVNFTADLLFSSPRHGVMAWLEEPSPMGTLEFFSGNTAFVSAGIVKDPTLIFDEIKQFVETTTGKSWDEVDTQDQQVRQIRDNFIASLGGELAVGLDGPAVPTPAWKILIEVYDEVLFQQTLEQAIALLESHSDAADVSLTPASVGIYSGYQLQFTARFDGPNGVIATPMSVNYAYVDGYLLIAPNIPLVERAINQYLSGVGLLAEENFRALLPNDYLDVSALSYNQIIRFVNDLLKNLPAGVALSGEQREELYNVYRESYGGSLMAVVGEPEVIHFVQSGSSLLPINLSSIFNLQSVMGILIGEDALVNLPGAVQVDGEIDIDYDGDF